MPRPCDLDERAQDPYIECPYCRARIGGRCMGEELTEIEEQRFRREQLKGVDPLG